MLWSCTQQLDRHTIVMATPAFPRKQTAKTPLDVMATTVCFMDARFLGTKMLSAKEGVALTEPQH